MLQDNSLIFAEDNKDVAKSAILEVNGTSLAKKAFVFCTLPSPMSGCVITLSSANALTDSTTVNALTTEIHYASATDLARGWMAFPLPLNDYKYAQVAIDITAASDLVKDFVCGITDNPSNIESHVAAGY